MGDMKFTQMFIEGHGVPQNIFWGTWARYWGTLSLPYFEAYYMDGK